MRTRARVDPPIPSYLKGNKPPPIPAGKGRETYAPEALPLRVAALLPIRQSAAHEALFSEKEPETPGNKPDFKTICPQMKTISDIFQNHLSIDGIHPGTDKNHLSTEETCLSTDENQLLYR